VESFLEHGLLAVFVALLLAPLGFPIPEDISLLSAGALAWHGHASLPAAWAVGVLGVILSDTLLWTLGHRVGLHPKGLIGRKVGRRRIRKISRFYDRFGPYTVAICRALPGTRFPAFFFAGATRMPLQKFLLIDGIAAIFYVALLVGVGNALGDEIGQVAAVMHRFRVWTLVGVGLVGAFLLWRFLREPGDEPEANNPEPRE
jgi:membrane protein DedA with SNARE-associated domain